MEVCGRELEAEQLKDGEFTIRTETGGNPKLKIYMARKDIAGRFWYAGPGLASGHMILALRW